MTEPAPILSQDFRKFLVEAKQHGYGTPDANESTTGSGAKVITYARDQYMYVDNFVGGNPYGGYEHVSVLEAGEYLPIWDMGYRQTYKADSFSDNKLVETLGKVLAQPKPELPLRGPIHWEEGDLRYVVQAANRDSALEDFDIEEFIYTGHRKVYVARFMGGLINKSKIPELVFENGTQ